MPKEKRNNLAIYTLAGSILISSVLVSMNQANGVPSDRDMSVLQMEVRNLKSDLSSYKKCMNRNMTHIQFATSEFVSNCR
jgi:hypothetical protein